LAEIAGKRLIWNLEKCEEIAISGAFVIVSARLNEEWTHGFSAKFFGQGLAVSDHYLQTLNKALKRCGMDELDIRESDPSDYARDFSDYDAKISFREEQRHRFTVASAPERMRMLGNAIDAMAQLLPPHLTFAEYKQIYGKPDSPIGKLHHAEQRRRLAALENATKDGQEMKPQRKPTLSLEQAITLLKNTTNPALVERIVDRLDTDTHIQLVASDDLSQEMKDLIIERILAA
jgi:hypothetical protein